MRTSNEPSIVVARNEPTLTNTTKRMAATTTTQQQQQQQRQQHVGTQRGSPDAAAVCIIVNGTVDTDVVVSPVGPSEQERMYKEPSILEVHGKHTRSNSTGTPSAGTVASANQTNHSDNDSSFGVRDETIADCKDDDNSKDDNNNNHHEATALGRKKKKSHRRIPRMKGWSKSKRNGKKNAQPRIASESLV